MGIDHALDLCGSSINHGMVLSFLVLASACIVFLVAVALVARGSTPRKEIVKL